LTTPLTRTAPKPSTDSVTEYLEVDLTNGRLTSTKPIKGKIERSEGGLTRLRVCLGFMPAYEANRGANVEGLNQLLKEKKVKFETVFAEASLYSLDEVPATGVTENYLYGWRVQVNQAETEITSAIGPVFLGSNELYVPDLRSATLELLCQSQLELLGEITNPTSPPDPNKRAALLPSPVVPQQFMLSSATFKGDSRTLRVFAVVQRPNLYVPREPVGIPYVVEAVKKSGTVDWTATNIHSAVVEPTNALVADNELIIWEFQGGSNWVSYRRKFFGQATPPRP